MRINERDTVTTLSAVAGFVDTAGFMALFGMFTAHVTGNLVAVVGLIDDPVPVGAAARFAMIPVFMGSVVATSFLARTIRGRGQPALPGLLAWMSIVLGAFCIVGGASHCASESQQHGVVALVAALGTAAMAVQNTIMRDVLKRRAPTTLMTGNLTNFTMHLTDLLLPDEDDVTGVGRARARQGLVECGVPLTSFLGGAVLGGCLTNLAGLWSVAVPALTVAVLAAANRSRQEGQEGQEGPAQTSRPHGASEAA